MSGNRLIKLFNIRNSIAIFNLTGALLTEIKLCQYLFNFTKCNKEAKKRGLVQRQTTNQQTKQRNKKIKIKSKKA